MSTDNDRPDPTKSQRDPFEVGDPKPQLDHGATTAVPEIPPSEAELDSRKTAVGVTPTPSQPSAAPKRAEASGTTFPPGSLVAERYRIVDFIAAGGMGEVYEAEDTELKKRVALKTIKSDIAKDGPALERFKQEIHLSHQITHPNVCRIFDIDHHVHERADGSKERITFLSMELLPGESLAGLLKRRGPMSISAAVPLFRQMASALAAAHEKGVIHRDFKSGNVMLVPEEEGLRVSVADFGLARSELAMATFAEVAKDEEKMVLGTPAYMAPEQVEAGKLTPALDVYALGIVFYEMLTGKLPFTGKTPLELALARLERPPVPIREHLPEIDEKWEAVIDRCLQRKPEDRYPDAGAVIAHLDAMDRAVEHRKVRRRVMLPAAILGTIAVIGGVILTYFGVKPAERNSVAVLGFKNLSGKPEAAWLSTALSEMLVAEVAVGGEMRVIPGENVARMKRELELAESESLTAEDLERVGANLGTDLVLMGSYLTVGAAGTGNVRLVLHLQDVARGKTVETFTAQGTEEDLFGLITTASMGLREYLRLTEVTSEQRGALRAAFPKDQLAAKLYSIGLERVRNYDYLGAQKPLEEAVKAEPDHPLPHLALSGVWKALGYEQRARDEAKAALDTSAGLPDRQKLEVEAGYYRSQKDWAREVELYKTLLEKYPKDLEYGLRLAAAQAKSSVDDALATLAGLRQLEPPASEDPRIDLYEAMVAGSGALAERQQAAAMAAAAKGEKTGATLLVAQANLESSFALRSQNKLEEAAAAAEKAREFFATPGDRAGVAKALLALGHVLAEGGDAAGAKARYDEALATYREIGDLDGTATALNGLASVLFGAGDVEGAAAAFEESLAIREQLGDLQGMADLLNNLAILFYTRGDLAQAAARYDQALALAREVGNQQGQILALVNAAEVKVAAGEPAAAAAMANEAAQLSQQAGWLVGAVAAVYHLGEAHTMSDDLTAARNRLDKALELGNQAQVPAVLAPTLRANAELLLEEGKPAEAAAAASQAVEASRAAASYKDFAFAQAVLARASLALGQIAEAKAAADMTGKAAAASQNLEANILAAGIAALVEAQPALSEVARAELAAATASVAAVQAELDAVSAEPAGAEGREARLTAAQEKLAAAQAQEQAAQAGVEALPAARRSAPARLEEAVAAATQSGLHKVALELGLMLGRLEVAAGQGAAGQRRLQAVEREARQRGMLLVARHAAEAG